MVRSLSLVTALLAGALVLPFSAVAELPPGCTPGSLCAGAAKRMVTPAQSHIDGVDEARIAGTGHVQKFNLGGFGIDPLQNFPDPIGAFGDSLTDPAEERIFSGSQGDEDTWVRALVVIEPGSRTEIAFLILDAVGAGNIIQNEVKAAIFDATGIAPDNVLFGQTHTHAGADLQGLWGGVPQDWIATILVPAAAGAVEAARNAAVPATMQVSQGTTFEFNNYRRPRVDEDAEADGIMTLLQAIDGEGEVIGSVLQYSGHPTSINEDPRVPHPDYPLGATDWLESQDGGVALYFNGPIADASSSGTRSGCGYPGDADYGNQRCKGEGIAEFARGTKPSARTLAPTIETHHAQVILPITNPLFVVAGATGSFNRYYDFTELPLTDVPLLGPEYRNLPQLTPVAITTVSRVTIGGTDGLEVVTIPGETTNTFGQFVRSLAPGDARVMLLGLTHNSFGYIIPEEEFSYVDPSGHAGLVDVPFTGYEEFVSLGPLTAPMLRLQGYLPIFETSPADVEPVWLQKCADPTDDGCILNEIGRKIDYIQRSYAAQCRDFGGPEEFCSLLDPETPLAAPCLDNGFSSDFCSGL